jgi:Domain of unknown function (DUF4372)
MKTKGTTFSGQPVFAQLTRLIDRSTFAILVKEHGADHYCKRCNSWEHLISMLYGIMNNFTSLREITHGITTYGDKLNHLGISLPFCDSSSTLLQLFNSLIYTRLQFHISIIKEL